MHTLKIPNHCVLQEWYFGDDGWIYPRYADHFQDWINHYKIDKTSLPRFRRGEPLYTSMWRNKMIFDYKIILPEELAIIFKLTYD